MNEVQLIGRLTRDPEVRYTTGDEPKAMARFTLAIDDGWGANKSTNFIPIIVWGKQAENCEKYLFKGNQCGVTGRIKTGSYEKDGRKVYTTDIIANRVEFLGTKSENGGSQGDLPTGFKAVDEDIPF